MENQENTFRCKVDIGALIFTSTIWGGSLFYLIYSGPQNPILIIKAPILYECLQEREADRLQAKGCQIVLRRCFHLSSAKMGDRMLYMGPLVVSDMALPLA